MISMNWVLEVDRLRPENHDLKLPPDSRSLAIKEYTPAKDSGGAGTSTALLGSGRNSLASDELVRQWIMHAVPRYVQVSGNNLKKILCGRAPLSYSLFDVAIRRLNLLDKLMHALKYLIHWRHILESDFVMLVFAGEKVTGNSSVRKQFIGEELLRQIETCRMIPSRRHSTSVHSRLLPAPPAPSRHRRLLPTASAPPATRGSSPPPQRLPALKMSTHSSGSCSAFSSPPDLAPLHPCMHVLGNANPAENVPVRNQLMFGGTDSEIHRCRQITIPVRSPRSWCAYTWDMKMQKTWVLDPMSAMASVDDTLEAHRPTIERLHAALANCIELCFDGWNPEWQKWDIYVVKSDNLTATPEQSALYTLFSIINFDGQKLVAEPTPEAIKMFKQNCLYEMMSIKENKGKVPSIFVHTIED